MSEQEKVSEFTGRKPSEYNSGSNINNFNQELANLINSHSDKVALFSLIGSLEIMKADILHNAMTGKTTMPDNKETH